MGIQVALLLGMYEAQILHTIRQFNGKLDWQGLAAAVGADSLPAFQAAVTSLYRARAFGLEFDDGGTVRFWTLDEREGDEQHDDHQPSRQVASQAAGDQPKGSADADRDRGHDQRFG
jgi:hypothetical protein